MNFQILAAALAFCGVLSAAFWLLAATRGLAEGGELAERSRSLTRAIAHVAREGRLDQSFGGARFLLASCASGALLGWALLGVPGIPFGAVGGPLALRAFLRARRRRRAAGIDACSADFAQAMASGLAAGRSVRGALLGASAATPDPLRQELDRALVDLALGGSVSDVLAGLRRRTGSTRIESLAGAIELHGGSGGDLVKLMRELAEAFRDRDRALRDAYAASAQARFTSYTVAAIPIGVCAVLELASPGMVTGAARFVPTAVMLAIAAALLIVGVALCQRIAAIRT